MKRKKNTREFLLLCLLMLALGCLYTWSYLAVLLEDTLQWNSGMTADIFTCSIIFYSVGNIMGGILSKRVRGRSIFLISAVCILAGLWCAADIRSYGAVMGFYGVLYSLGVGLAYNTGMSLAKRHLGQNMGTGMGILLFANGSTAFLAGGLLQGLLDTRGISGTVRVLGLVITAVVLLCMLVSQTPDKRQNGGKSEISFRILKEKKFYLLYLWGGLLAAMGLFVVGKSTSILAEITEEPFLLAGIAGAVAVCNGAGRIISGQLFDRKGTFWCIRKLSVLAATVTLLLFISFVNRWGWVCAAAILLCAYLMGAVSPSIAMFAKTYFDNEDYEINFSIFASEIVISSLIGSTLTGKMAVHFGSYQNSILMLVAMAWTAWAVGAYFLKIQKCE